MGPLPTTVKGDWAAVEGLPPLVSTRVEVVVGESRSLPFCTAPGTIGSFGHEPVLLTPWEELLLLAVLPVA